MTSSTVGPGIATRIAEAAVKASQCSMDTVSPRSGGRYQSCDSPAWQSAMATPAPTRTRSSIPDEVAIRIRPPVAEELPLVAHLAHHVHVHLGGQEFVLVLARLGDDLAARVDEIG